MKVEKQTVTQKSESNKLFKKQIDLFKIEFYALIPIVTVENLSR
jgi:hypothetical protein